MSGKDPAISIVTRCHNHGGFLEDAITSAVQQTRPVQEIVVVNDGSTDETAAILERLESGEPRLVTITHRVARGAAAAFNAGVEASHGDLILPLDADDRLSSRYAELTTQSLLETGADLAYGGEHRFGSEATRRPAHRWDPDELMVENYLHVSTLFRRWVFDATGGFDERFESTGLEDWAFWIGAVESGAAGVPVDGCWLEYRRHAGASRNRISRSRAGRAHYRAWRLHPTVLRPRHLANWIARSALRNLGTFRRSMPR